MELRNYQNTAVENVLQDFNSGHQGIFLVIPTGGGKTLCFCTIAQRKQQEIENYKVIVLTHRKTLLAQISSKLSDMGIEHGIIQAKTVKNPNALIQVAMVQTLKKRTLPFVPDLFVVDEAHIVPAPSFKPIFDQAPKAKRLLVSATPERADGEGFTEFADKLIVGATVSQLIEQGFLVPPKYYEGKGDFLQSYLTHAKGKKTIIFADSIAQVTSITQAFKRAGIKAEALTSKLKEDEQVKILKAFTEGQFDVLVNDDIVAEGFDFPALQAVLLTHTMGSRTAYLQKTGRVLRIFPGKTEGIIIDHGGNREKHGGVEDVREHQLEGRYKKPLYLVEVAELRRNKPERCEQIKRVYQQELNFKCRAMPFWRAKYSAWGTILLRHGYSLEEMISGLGDDWLDEYVVKNDYRPTYEPKPEADNSQAPLESASVHVEVNSFRQVNDNTYFADLYLQPLNITLPQQKVTKVNGQLATRLKLLKESSAYDKAAYVEAANKAINTHLVKH